MRHVYAGLAGDQQANPLQKIAQASVAFAMALTWAPSSVHSKVESAVAVTPIVTVFLGSVERRFSVPAMVRPAAARSLGQAWPQAIAGGDAQRA